MGSLSLTLIYINTHIGDMYMTLFNPLDDLYGVQVFWGIMPKSI